MNSFIYSHSLTSHNTHAIPSHQPTGYKYHTSCISHQDLKCIHRIELKILVIIYNHLYLSQPICCELKILKCNYLLLVYSQCSLKPFLFRDYHLVNILKISNLFELFFKTQTLLSYNMTAS
ncbi:hypothetical protein NBO_947g0001 [Nosema bombycis CQ1]|uniref:Uncharacterized protein n=1 Tax=Nosema bombycis (strain CQ1 / CVCC 102059) TaxID=578461 RepID=R0M0V2_NOSB1|nr:hypothetical protein NBO_947g0001 [Nosema bombycis CQ1]|eukprot:EOB11659.1 hypothetical protein NBO_947g0001 [Nosema bombycis CQ1]